MILSRDVHNILAQSNSKNPPPQNTEKVAATIGAVDGGGFPGKLKRFPIFSCLFIYRWHRFGENLKPEERMG